jgi:tRNA threonylcarbamoyladenosine modification (KEOPS) complex Cgi121 subunit
VRGPLPPLPKPEERSLRAVGARRTAPGAPSTGDLVRTLRDLGRDSKTLVALFDAGAIAGERHLLSAWAHLGRSRGRGETRLRERGAEFALYVAGEDQLPRALARVGVTDATEQFVVVAERPLDPVELVTTFGLLPDPSAYPRPVEAGLLERLGITEVERAAVPPSAWEGLVLERVALVDLTTPSGHGTTAKH